jgi:hypothetical protein
MEMIVRASRKGYHIEEVELYIFLSWFMVEIDEICAWEVVWVLILIKSNFLFFIFLIFKLVSLLFHLLSNTKFTGLSLKSYTDILDISFG